MRPLCSGECGCCRWRLGSVRSFLRLHGALHDLRWLEVIFEAKKRLFLSKRRKSKSSRDEQRGRRQESETATRSCSHNRDARRRECPGVLICLLDPGQSNGSLTITGPGRTRRTTRLASFPSHPAPLSPLSAMVCLHSTRTQTSFKSR